MENYKNINNCPICNNEENIPYLTCKDYTVSQDNFEIVECTKCQFHYTTPIPIESEIGGYYKSESYISHSSTNKGLINKIYQKVRNFTLKQKVKLITKYAKGKNHLDIGAGTGHFINATSKAGFNSVGLEPDSDARQLATKNFKVNINPLEDLQGLENNSQDIITMWHVLEHVYNLREDLKKITSVLKDDGTMIVAVPNMNSYDAKKHKEFWAAYDLPIHLYHFTPNDIRNLFDHYNMEVKEILPMKFDSYYVSMLSEKYKGGNNIAAFFTGLKSNMKANRETYSSQIYILQKK